MDISEPTIFEKLVIEKKFEIKTETTTGQKENVKVYFNMFRGTMQATVKYGDKFYNFEMKDRDLGDLVYSLRNNIKGDDVRKEGLIEYYNSVILMDMAQKQAAEMEAEDKRIKQEQITKLLEDKKKIDDDIAKLQKSD